MSEKLVEVVPWTNTYYLDIPGDLPGAIAWIQTKLSEIPEVFRVNSVFSFGTEGDPEGGSWPTINIWYARPFTEQELADLARDEKEKESAKTAEELKELTRLLAKYKPEASKEQDGPLNATIDLDAALKNTIELFGHEIEASKAFEERLKNPQELAQGWIRLDYRGDCD